MPTHTLLKCTANCDGFVFGGAGVWEIVRPLDRKQQVAPGNSFAWCKNCRRKYEIRQVPETKRAA